MKVNEGKSKLVEEFEVCKIEKLDKCFVYVMFLLKIIDFLVILYGYVI